MKKTLKELDTFFVDLEFKFKFMDLLNPVNCAEEKEKFIAKNYNYNPQFVYSIPSDFLLNMKNELAGVEIEEHEFSRFYKNKIDEVIAKINLIESNDNDFTKFSKQLYGELSVKYLNKAEEIIHSKIKNSVREKKEYLSLDELVSQVEEKIAHYGLESKIIIRDEDTVNNSFKVNHVRNEIIFYKNCKKTKEELEATLAHEVDTHLLRGLNGKKITPQIFFLGTAGYLAEEEGLAVLMSYSKRNNKQLFRPALLFKLIDLAEKNDFKEVFKFVFEISGKFNYSWNQTLRVKRGISDTNRPGAFFKDQYFSWAMDTGRKILKNPESLNYIFNGKGDLKYLMKYTLPNDKINLIKIENIKNIFNINKINY